MFRGFSNAKDKPVKQTKINHICSALTLCKIRTTQDLIEHIDALIAMIKQNPKVFKPDYSPRQVLNILNEALKAYNAVHDYQIKIPQFFIFTLNESLKKASSHHAPVHSDQHDDLTKVTHSYDRLVHAQQKKQEMNDAIAESIKGKDHVEVSTLIIGSGDTGTTLWLEKYKHTHNKTNTSLSHGQVPQILMVADGTGSWKHDYTLAQPHSILERTSGKANPSDFVSTDYYHKNPYANGRHVYQANQISLGKTEAPLLDAVVIKIEKKSKHTADWRYPASDYRVILKTNDGLKNIYTNDLNICTGLGPARNALRGTVIRDDDFKRLNKFDDKKKFTPIVDGNQFILTGSEEMSKSHKTIVIYGGGGTAAACYRKGFFGTDINTEGRAFTNDAQKNKVIWVARQFDKAGTGKLATTALKTSEERKERFQGELISIISQADGKLALKFVDATKNPITIICDQLIFSIGQDDKEMRKVCEEVDADLQLNHDTHGMILNVSTGDKKVTFHGAAAMAVRENAYMEATWKWLQEQNIGGDVGPGSMPPTRAQIKRANSLHGFAPDSINANMDTLPLVKEYLCKAGVEEPVAKEFADKLLQARKHSTSGCTRSMLTALVSSSQLHEKVEVYGHGHIMLKRAQSEQTLQVAAKAVVPAAVAPPSQQETVKVDSKAMPKTTPKVAKKAGNADNTSRLFAVIDREDDKNSYIHRDTGKNKFPAIKPDANPVQAPVVISAKK